jgi:uncharacterized coiled-coil protein SlyX
MQARNSVLERRKEHVDRSIQDLAQIANETQMTREELTEHYFHLLEKFKKSELEKESMQRRGEELTQQLGVRPRTADRTNDGRMQKRKWHAIAR